MAELIKAYVTDVKLGSLQIEGLMAEDSRFLVGFPQICDLFNVPQKNASRDFKLLLGKDSTFLRVKLDGTKITMYAVTLPDFERLLARLDRKGNVIAQEMRDNFAGLSLHQLFADAFGVKFEAEERQVWLIDRQAGIKVRRTFTDAIRDYIARHPELSENRAKYLYNNATDRVYKAVFGRISRVLSKDLQATDTLRDHFTADELRHVAMIEEEAMYIIDRQDIEPCEAVLMARAKFSFDISQRPEIA